jgi:hypothetical protein
MECKSQSHLRDSGVNATLGRREGVSLYQCVCCVVFRMEL